MPEILIIPIQDIKVGDFVTTWNAAVARITTNKGYIFFLLDDRTLCRFHRSTTRTIEVKREQ